MNYRSLKGRSSIRTLHPGKVGSANRRLKLAYWADGIRTCEVCGWKAPAGIFRQSKQIGLRIHHITPLFLHGPLEDRENTALLCPNHAALGDLVVMQSITWDGVFKGPKDRYSLFRVLKELDERADMEPVLLTAPAAMEGLKAD